MARTGARVRDAAQGSAPAAVVGRRRSAEMLSDASLVAGMRAGDEQATAEFLARFGPLLAHCARRLRGEPAECAELAHDVLTDAAIALGAGQARVPRSIAAYLVTSLRHRFLNSRRDAARRDARLGTGVAGRGAGVPEDAVAATSSEASRRATGVDAGSAASDAVTRLAAALDAQLDDGERALLVWLSERVPQREIAAWVGVSYAAVVKRVERLRVRLRAAALAYAGAAPLAERAVLERIFERAAGAAVSAPTPDEEEPHR